jgi:chromosome segregation ATPase
MWLTPGDFVVLGVVLVILMVFRQIDRNNRSMEKIKRYADKVIADLDGLINEKATKIKDMGIELEVHQKAAKEVLNRIQGTEENLNSRVIQIENIGNRIGDYDSALDELMKMTKQAEINMSRLREESEFTDKVSKRLRQASGRMSEIERTIPNLVSKFQEYNNQQIAVIEDKIFQETQDKLTVMSNRIDQEGEQVDEMLQKVRNEASETKDRMEAGIADYRGRMENIEQDFLNRLDQLVAKGEKLETRGLEKLREHIELRIKEAAKNLNESINAIRADVDDANVQMSKELDSNWSEINQELADIKNSMSDRLEDMDAEVDKIENKMESKLTAAETRSENLADGVLGEIKNHLDEKIQNVTFEMDQTVEGFKSSLTAKQENMQIGLERLVKRFEEWDSRTDGYINNLENQKNKSQELIGEIDHHHGEFERRADELKGSISSLQNELVKKLSETTFTVEDKVIGNIENRLSEYESVFQARLEKIESVNTDIDGLESNLKELMDQVTENIREELKDFDDQMTDKRKKSLAEAEDDMEAVHKEIRSLENEINELKTSAYNNVSQKLKVFEDEFFTDLKERNLSMQNRLSTWQEEIEASIQGITSNEKTERSKMENAFSQELKLKLEGIRQRVDTQFSEFKNEMTEYQGTLKENFDLIDKDMDTFRNNIRGEINEVKESSANEFNHEFAEYNANVGEKVRNFEKEVSNRLDEMRSYIEEKDSDFADFIENTQSDLNRWQTKVTQDMKAGETDLNNQLANLKVQILGTIGQVKEDLAQQREEIITGTQEERDQLRNELELINTTVGSLREEMQDKANSVVQLIDKREVEVKNETEAQIKDFRSLSENTRNQFEAMRKKLFGKIQEDYNMLLVNLQEIEKKQKNFTEQTKIFERGDAMKRGLEQDIQELKEEIGRIEERRREIKDMENQLEKIKKSSESVSEKVSKFFAEKRKIDSLESDYQKLISMSQAVETKIEKVNASNDTLQDIQIRLKSLDDLEKEVEARFDRLEKKRSILDMTMQGVDKSFQQLEGIEGKVKNLENSIDIFPEQMEDISQRLSALMDNKEDADDAIRKLSEIQGALSDIEGRMEDLQKAREWLARTESRLEEVGRQAQDQIKILGTLIKDEVKTTGKNKEGGAPPNSSREMVVKLARQGWTVKEIARATKLGVGEVELILEMGVK